MNKSLKILDDWPSVIFCGACQRVSMDAWNCCPLCWRKATNKTEFPYAQRWKLFAELTRKLISRPWNKPVIVAMEIIKFPKIQNDRQARSNTKSMLVCFFRCEMKSWRNFIRTDKQWKGEFYGKVLRGVCDIEFTEHVLTYRPTSHSSCITMHSAQTPAIVCEVLAYMNFTIIPYSPDLAPRNLLVFPKLKTRLQVQRLGMVERSRR